MRFHQAPRPLLQLVTAILLAGPRLALANPNPHPSEQAGFSFDELFARYECGGSLCGYYNQLCCSAGSACATVADIATCTASGSAATVTSAGGYWEYYTTTYVETDLVTVTSVMSSYVAGVATATATATASCNYALNETPCGSICCASSQYCFSSGQCSAAAGGSSGYYSTYTAGASASAAVRPTTSGTVVIVATVTPTTTVPFITPVPTGANITISGSSSDNGGSGLSGGAIAGIVIGVLVGLALLGLICFYCCLKGLLDGCLACFGLGGRKRKRTTEVEEYERYSHHSGRAGGRTWYGAARPATRVDRTEKRSHEGRNLLGIGAGLAALWAILGLKRRRENRRRTEQYSDVSTDDYYYTSASSASSDDRRTRETRYSRR